MNIRKRVSIAILAMTMAVMFCVPAVSWAETAAADQPQARSAEMQLLDRSNDRAEAGKAFVQSIDLDAEAKDAEVSESFRAQSFLELWKAGKLKCTNENLTLEENKEGEGLLITGKPADMNGAYLTVEGDFVFGKNKVARLRLDGLSKTKTNATAAFYMDGSKSPFTSIPLRMQKGSKTWSWPGDGMADVREQNIQGTHTLAIELTTDSTAKNTSVLLREFEFMMEDGLPTVYLDIDESIQTITAMNTDPEHLTECYGNMTLQIPAGYQSEYSSTPAEETTSTTYEMEYIRGRGNSTWSADKKPYKIKLDKKADLLGMGTNKHWVLLANRYDNTLLRNKITYWMGDRIGMEFTPQCEFVDVVMNGEYLGCYYLCEQIRVGESRVEINDLEDDSKTAAANNDGIYATEEPQITGGYLLGMCPYSDDIEKYPDQMLQTTRKHEFQIESPEFENGQTEEVKEAQRGYIGGYLQKTEDAIYGKDFRDANGVSWEEYLDKESTINYYWFQEVSMNGDGFISPSSYMYKKRDGKLYFGPLWDFDYVAWGDLQYDDPQIEGFYQNGNFWYERLMASEDFVKDLKDGYGKIHDVLQDAQSQLDKYADKIRVADFYEREKWGAYREYYEDYSGGYYAGNQAEDEGSTPKEYSFQEEVDLLKTWIKTRDEWVSKNMDELKSRELKVSFKVDGKVISTQTFKEGDYLTNIPDPGTRKGKVFAGWYVESDYYSYRMNFRDQVYEEMTLFAKWVDASKEVKVKNIYFQADPMVVESDFEVFIGEPVAIPCQIVPFNATQQDLTWTSSDPSVLEVDAKTGLARPFKRGTVTVTATAANGVKATCKIVVRSYSDETEGYSYNLAKDTITVYVGDYGRVQIDSGGTPINPFNIYYQVEDEGILEMGEAGVFRALKEGTTVILVEDNYTESTLTCKVIVKFKEKKGAAVSRSGLKYVITKPWTKKTKAGTVKVKGFESDSAKTVKIPATIKINGHKYKVTAVAAKAFQADSALQTVTIGGNVKAIGSKAFAGCKKLRSVTFGKGVRTIGAKAFYKAKKLKKVTFTGKTIKKIGAKAFGGIAKKAVITVPNSGKKAYKKRLKKKAGITKKMKIRVKKVSYKKL